MSDSETTWDGSHPAIGCEKGASITLLLTVEDASRLHLSPKALLRVVREALGLDRDISSESPTKQRYVATIQQNGDHLERGRQYYKRVTVESRDHTHPGYGPSFKHESGKHEEINWDEVW